MAYGPNIKQVPERRTDGHMYNMYKMKHMYNTTVRSERQTDGHTDGPTTKPDRQGTDITSK